LNDFASRKNLEMTHSFRFEVLRSVIDGEKFVGHSPARDPKNLYRSSDRCHFNPGELRKKGFGILGDMETAVLSH
jgi:hypothetical protein